MTTPFNQDRTLASAHEEVVLVMQGGGALGAYQAGVFEGMVRRGIRPTRLAGISIGAINAALIAGNPPERQVDRLRAFWHGLSEGHGPGAWPAAERPWAAARALWFGVPGFFVPRLPPAVLAGPGSGQALSFYDSTPLRSTLRELIDLDRLNARGQRLSVGAVNVRSGELRYFDSAVERIGIDHIMASAALPPGLPPVEIDGEHYWDGGIVSNTPLWHVLEGAARRNRAVFQVDLFSARGTLPRHLGEVIEREKDIRFASRARHDTETLKRLHRMRIAAAELLTQLPPRLRHSEAAQALAAGAPTTRLTLVHLIHRRQRCDSAAKDFEFSRSSVLEHWAEGRADLDRALDAAAWRHRSLSHSPLVVIDGGRTTKTQQERAKS